jgi:hypothetical protein
MRSGRTGARSLKIPDGKWLKKGAQMTLPVTMRIFSDYV